jgi:hypothetical protein
MQKHQATLSAFQFRRTTADLIQVYNEGSYLMAEYNERTGITSWQRVLLATQREIIERWLREHYPVKVAPPAPKKVRAEVPARRRAVAPPARRAASRPTRSSSRAGRPKHAKRAAR